MKKLYTLTTAVLLSVSLFSCNSDDSIRRAADQSVQQFEAAGTQNMENDAIYVAEAASMAMLQLRLSELAAEKAVSPEVKELAQRMQSDHQQVLTDLQNLAEQSMFTLPQELGNAHQKIYDELEGQSGISFDLSYVREVNELHDQALDRYTDMADNGVNMDVKMYASKQVPLIREHMALIEKISEQIESAR